jgi:hypothetical protein
MQKKIKASKLKRALKTLTANKTGQSRNTYAGQFTLNAFLGNASTLTRSSAFMMPGLPPYIPIEEIEEE